jgi:hypothetical protein
MVLTKITGSSHDVQLLSRLLASYTKELKPPRLTARGIRQERAQNNR